MIEIERQREEEKRKKEIERQREEEEVIERQKEEEERLKVIELERQKSLNIAKMGKRHTKERKDKKGKRKADVSEEDDLESEDDSPATPRPNQLEAALRSQFNSQRYSQLVNEASSIIRPNRTTDSGLTSDEGSRILGGFLDLPDEDRKSILGLSQQDISAMFQKAAYTKKRKDVKHIKSPEHKRPRRSMHTSSRRSLSPSTSPLSSPSLNPLDTFMDVD